MDTATLADLVANTGAQLYADRRSNPLAAAQDQLTGRTHYVDPQTLRYFHSRILGARSFCHGLIYRIIESTARDYDNSSRGFRYVVFDVWGQVVARPDLSDTVRTSDKARAEFDNWLGQFDPVSYYAERCAQRAARAMKEAQRLQAVAEACCPAA